MDSPPASPCRLWVCLARSAPLGVVIRRGPSEWTRLSLWHTDTDTFEHGQWLRGRIYERRCDLSADGSLFGYFAFQPQRYPQETSWTALARPPWFSALALWYGLGTWSWGAYFPEPGSLWGVRGAPDRGRLPPWLSLTDLAHRANVRFNGALGPIFVRRLLRDGWRETHGLGTGRDRHKWWERANWASQRSLLMVVPPDAEEADPIDYAVLSDGDTGLDSIGLATWADWDQRWRLVFAQGGRLLHWRGPDGVALIADFNAQTPEPAPAPDWVHEWPGPPRL